MSATKTSLNVIHIQNPCPESWDEMHGDARVRFCDHCQLNVYNLSDMNRDEAEALLSHREGKLCVRYYQRSDGGVITRDCKGGLRRRVGRAAMFAASASVALLATALSAMGMSLAADQCADNPDTATRSTGWLRLFNRPPVVQNQEMMGKMVIPRQVAPVPQAAKMGEATVRSIQGDVAAPASQPASRPTNPE